MTSNESAAILMTMVSSVMLGSSYVAVKMGVGGTDPFLFGAVAMAVGSIILIIYMALKGSLTSSMFKHWEFWMGPVLNTVVVAAQYIGLTMTTAAVGGLIVGSNVIFVTLFSRMLFKERLGKIRAIGLTIGFLGLITLTTKWNVGSLRGDQLVGDMFVLLSALFIGLVVVMSRYALKKMEYDQWTLGLHMFLPFTLFGLALIVGDTTRFETDALLNMIYIGAMCSTVPTLLWVKALKHISVVTSATVLMLESTFAVVLSWLILGESVDAFVLAGALMTFMAIYLVARGGQS